MGLFGDLDVATASDNPNAVPDNTYEAYLTDLAVAPTRDGTKTGLTLKYRIAGGEYEGRTVQEWKEIPSEESLTHADPEIRAKAAQALSYLKLRLKSLGIASDKMNSVEPKDLIGKHVTIKVVNNQSGFPNIRGLTLVDANAAASDGGGRFSGL